MPPLITQVDPKEIEQLTSDDLVRLLHRLLHCEARKLNISNPKILVPFQTTVPDGGRDGRWEAEVGQHEYIPRTLTFYQSKAERITEAVCRTELVSREKKAGSKDVVFVVRPRVREVLSAGGCYAFFSNKHEIKPSDTAELSAVARDELQKAGFVLAEGACIEFYGCNRIADWVNKFPSAIQFVRERTKGFSSLHYSTIDGWSRRGRMSGKFFSNSAVETKIASIREELISQRSRIIRVTGLSGVGKTRLVHAAFSAGDDATPLHKALSESTIYINYADVPADLINFLAQLADGLSGVVVIDDCPPAVHERIIDVVANSSLSIVTIFHQPEPGRQDTRSLELKPEEMGDVVENILREDSKLVSRGESAIKAVAEFAKGFPQMAKLIAEFHRAPTLEELFDREPLAQKLLSQGDKPDNETLLTMQTLSMFRTIGGGATILTNQLEAIRQILCGEEISEGQFLRIIEQQKKRKVVQQIADTIMVVPRPLAVALAAAFVQGFPANRWRQSIDQINGAGLLEAFARRIEELEFSDKAGEVGELLLERGLPFDDAEYLLSGTTGSRMFRALAPLNPSAAVKVAVHAIDKYSVAELRERRSSRRDLVHALELLVWESDTFAEAARLLLKLGAAENEAWSNNAAGAFKHLFSLFLSGTRVPAMDRLQVIRDALTSSDTSVQELAIDALGAALQYRSFTRIDDATLGGKRDPSQDWRPTTRKEELDYWRESYRLLRTKALEDSPVSEHAKTVLANNIDVVLHSSLIYELDSDFRELAERFNHFWPAVKDHVRRILDFHDDLNSDHRAALEKWKDYLTPQSEALDLKLRDVVSNPGWHSKKSKNGEYLDLSRSEAEEFAGSIVDRDIDLLPHLSQLLQGPQQQTSAFAAVIAGRMPRIERLLQEALDTWPSLDPKTRNWSLLAGALAGLGQGNMLRTRLLDQIAKDPKLSPDLLIPLTASIFPLTEADLLRIVAAFKSKHVTTDALVYLVRGRPLRGLSAEFVIQQFAAILATDPSSAKELFDILALHCHGELQELHKYSEFFMRLLLEPGLSIFEVQSGWQWSEIAKTIVSTTDNKGWLKQLAEHICRAVVEEKNWIDTDYAALVTIELFRKAPEETWEVFGTALRESDDSGKYVLAEFLGKSGSRFDKSGSAIWELPRAQFTQWVRENRDLIPRVLDQIDLCNTENAGTPDEKLTWHPHATILLEEGTDERTLTNVLISNLLSFGSTGSRVPYLEKRLALVRNLKQSSNQQLVRIATALENVLTAEIKRTFREEQNENARFL